MNSWFSLDLMADIWPSWNLPLPELMLMYSYIRYTNVCEKVKLVDAVIKLAYKENLNDHYFTNLLVCWEVHNSKKCIKVHECCH